MPFFNTPGQFASLFTEPNWHSYERHGKFSVDGMKPIEAFLNDIRNNLTEWSVDRDSVFYKTKDHWYVFTLEREGELKGAVVMTRYDHGTWNRIDSWANPQSVAGVGKAWLSSEPQKSKRVALY